MCLDVCVALCMCEVTGHLCMMYRVSGIHEMREHVLLEQEEPGSPDSKPYLFLSLRWSTSQNHYLPNRCSRSLAWRGSHMAALGQACFNLQLTVPIPLAAGRSNSLYPHTKDSIDPDEHPGLLKASIYILGPRAMRWLLCSIIPWP